MFESYSGLILSLPNSIRLLLQFQVPDLVAVDGQQTGRSDFGSFANSRSSCIPRPLFAFLWLLMFGTLFSSTDCWAVARAYAYVRLVDDNIIIDKMLDLDTGTRSLAYCSLVVLQMQHNCDLFARKEKAFQRRIHSFIPYLPFHHT